jgi:hypothetical protein
MVQEAAAVGAAKQRVAHDLTRAEELLKLLGARSFLSAPLAPEYLMETMEWRDAIEDACSHGDGAARAELTVRIRQRRAEELAALAGAFRVAMPLADRGLSEHSSSQSAMPATPDIHGTPAVMSSDLRTALQDAAAALVRLRYLDRMLDRLTGDP